MYDAFTYQFAAMIGRMLNIKAPQIKYAAELRTPTQIAAVSNDGKQIVIRSSCTQLDKLFAIAHEMRHIWQSHNGGIGAYTPNTSAPNYTVYNDQFAEIDANAFAKIAIEQTLGITPLFNGLDDAVKRKISDRAEEIRNG